jgi:amidophosphoribosyltransferase
MDLAARQAIVEIEGKEPASLEAYTSPETNQYACMVDCICKKLNLTTLKYQNIHDMLEAIGIGAQNICTYCWNGKGE